MAWARIGNRCIHPGWDHCALKGQYAPHDRGSAHQRIRVVATAAGGDQSLPGKGGTIIAKVDCFNMFGCYADTLWGQPLTPSSQAICVFSSVPQYATKGKIGSVLLSFDMPAGYRGISLVPAVGLFHQRRVKIGQDGNLIWSPGSPMLVMFASDMSVDEPEQTIAIGVLLANRPAK